MLRLALVVVGLVAAASVPAAAQEFMPQAPTPVVTYSFDVDPDLPPPPASLTEMYLKHAALHSLDVLTTVSALNQGHAEGNPLLGKGHPAVLVGAKVGAMAASVYITQKLFKKNPKAAMVTMVVTNAVLSAVIVNNSAVLRQ